MELNEYQQAALRTMNTRIEQGTEDRLINCTLGLCGEAGEVADIIKKAVFHGHALPTCEVVKELGDVLWYLAVMANALGYSLSEVAEWNLSKLESRYPNGFSKEASINREV